MNLSVHEVRDTLLELVTTLKKKLSYTEGLVLERHPDPMDELTFKMEQEQIITNLQNARKQLLLVEGALAKLQDGTYGICEDCEEPIADRRLKAVPWAPRCVTCEEAVEKALKESKHSVFVDENSPSEEEGE